MKCATTAGALLGLVLAAPAVATKQCTDNAQGCGAAAAATHPKMAAPSALMKMLAFVASGGRHYGADTCGGNYVPEPTENHPFPDQTAGHAGPGPCYAPKPKHKPYRRSLQEILGLEWNLEADRKKMDAGYGKKKTPKPSKKPYPMLPSKKKKPYKPSKLSKPAYPSSSSKKTYPLPSKKPEYPGPSKKPYPSPSKKAYPSPSKDYPAPSKKPEYPSSSKKPDYPRSSKKPDYLPSIKNPDYPPSSMKPRPSKKPYQSKKLDYPSSSMKPDYLHSSMKPDYPPSSMKLEYPPSSMKLAYPPSSAKPAYPSSSSKPALPISLQQEARVSTETEHEVAVRGQKAESLAEAVPQASWETVSQASHEAGSQASWEVIAQVSWKANSQAQQEARQKALVHVTTEAHDFQEVYESLSGARATHRYNDPGYLARGNIQCHGRDNEGEFAAGSSQWLARWQQQQWHAGAWRSFAAAGSATMRMSMPRLAVRQITHDGL